MSIYQALKDAGVPLDSHESDLYAKATPECLEILRIHKSNGLCATPFKSEIDGSTWLDIPFAFEPWWEARK